MITVGRELKTEILAREVPAGRLGSIWRSRGWTMLPEEALMRRFGSLLLVILLSGLVLFAQREKQRNLETCLSGKYPALCNHSLLTFDQLQQVTAAEKRENLRVCVTGRYRALCDHSKLSAEEALLVRQAERSENLKICKTGKYVALCNHGLLSSDELSEVQAAERAENLRICMDGRYTPLCNHALLTAEQATVVAAAEARAASTRPRAPVPHGTGSRSKGCESGHWIDSVAGDGKIIKLEDGSMWEVDDVDTVTTSIWLPVSEVVVCGTKMINVDDDESADVTPIAGTSSRRGPTTQSSRPTYVVEASANDETFVINGNVFEAKTYCFDIEKGDRVIFLEGSPLGACVSAKLLNLRTERVCDVWCE